VEQGACAGSETVGHQMLDEEGNPTSPVINYIGRPQSDDGESE